MEDHKLVLASAVVGVVLNVVLALVLTPFATPEQIKPPEGAAQLDMVDQFMHMIVHHKQVLFMSSAIVFVLVALSVLITLQVNKRLRKR